MYTVLYYILYRHYQHQHQHPPSFSPHQSFSSFLATAPHHNHFQSSYLPFWGKLFYGITQRYPLVQKTIENGPVEMVEIHPSKMAARSARWTGRLVLPPGRHIGAVVPHQLPLAPERKQLPPEPAGRLCHCWHVPRTWCFWRCGSHNRSRRN